MGGNLDITVVALASEVVMYAIPMLAVVCVHKKSPRPQLFTHDNSSETCHRSNGLIEIPVVVLHADGSAELLRYVLQKG